MDVALFIPDNLKFLIRRLFAGTVLGKVRRRGGGGATTEWKFSWTRAKVTRVDVPNESRRLSCLVLLPLHRDPVGPKLVGRLRRKRKEEESVEY